ncbi:MAG: biopolymer transporter ExbD [Opitutaceae bacterium]|nr:biopolymer transporter ExbD [Opitutaceae bacterium]
MARTFRRRQAQHAISELNVTNLIDVAFTLLIIFMIATPLIQQEQRIEVKLPTESTRPQTQPDPKDVFQVIAIDRTGQYYWGTRRVDFSELPVLLAAEARKPNPPVLRIRADSDIQYQKVVTLMDEIKKHNLSRFTFDTQTAN